MRSEFEFIQNLKSKYSLRAIGDDCAVLPKDNKSDMVVTADMLVEDIDFRLDWTTPEFLGHKALAVSLSDIAAMGAVPTWAMLSLGVPEHLWKTDFLDKFYDGWHRLARRSRVELVGGDVSRTLDKFVIDSVAGGEVPKGSAIMRSGASEGDAIIVTDHIGGSAGGLKLLESGRRIGENTENWEDVMLSIHLQPRPQTGTGVYLQKQKIAHSMIDISDGLASDLQHICNASNVGARLSAEKIPINRNLDHLFDSFDEQLEFALNGGEDFQLLFTVPPDKIPQLSAALIGGGENGLFTIIGEITADVGVIELCSASQNRVLQPDGYRHF